MNSLSPLAATDDDGIIHLLADQDATFPRSSERVDHDIIRKNVELLLVLALDVGGAGETDKVDQSGFTDIGGDVFGSDLVCINPVGRRGIKCSQMGTRRGGIEVMQKRSGRDGYGSSSDVIGWYGAESIQV